VSVGALPFREVRARAQAALAPRSDEDPPVLLEVDALDPPAIMLLWDNPWLSPVSVSQTCLFDARLLVLCVAGRIDPNPGVETCENLAAYALERLRDDAYTWTIVSATAPGLFTIANVPLLAGQLSYRVPVTL